MPDFENRTTAMGKLGKIFAEIFKCSSQLEETTGKNLTLYSLRHTAIMYRLEKGDVDTLTLAKNARTSQISAGTILCVAYDYRAGASATSFVHRRTRNPIWKNNGSEDEEQLEICAACSINATVG
jgi:hypothetical protein